MIGRIEYLLAAFEQHLVEGHRSDRAWSLALSDYAYVYFGSDNGTELQKAAIRALIDHPLETESAND